MGFFNKFALALTTIDRKPTIITDVFRRIAVGSRFNDVSAILLPYFVLDGETPEIVSNKLYDTPFYHWIILHCNNIVDPREEWPLEDKYVTSLIYEKYDFVVSVDNSMYYHPGDIIGSYEDDVFTSAFRVTGVASSAIKLRSITGLAYIATSTRLRNLTEENITGVVVNYRLNAVTDPREAIHHYVDSSNDYIIDFDSENPDIESVSNYDYEQTVNDNKRTIRVLDPQYLGDFVRSYEQLVSA